MNSSTPFQFLPSMINDIFSNLLSHCIIALSPLNTESWAVLQHLSVRTNTTALYFVTLGISLWAYAPSGVQ